LVLFGLVWFDRHPVWFGLVTNLVKPVQTGSNRFRLARVMIASRLIDFPNLSRLAVDYLEIPASSVPAESANSAAGRTFDRRASLHSSS